MQCQMDHDFLYCVCQSAAALCVGVGSFSDPGDLPGLAHFLEHSEYSTRENQAFPLKKNRSSLVGQGLPFPQILLHFFLPPFRSSHVSFYLDSPKSQAKKFASESVQHKNTSYPQTLGLIWIWMRNSATI